MQLFKKRKTKQQVEDPVRQLELPNEVMQRLEMQDGQDAFVRIEGKSIRIEPVIKPKKEPRKHLLWLAALILIAVAGFYWYFENDAQVAFVGEQSIASTTLLVGTICGVLSFTLFFILAKRKRIEASSKYIYWRNFPAVLLSFTIVLVVGIMGFFKLMELTFGGASFDPYTATFLFFCFISSIVFGMSYLAKIMTPTILTRVLSLVIVGGVILSMINNNDQNWWQENFSYLGTPDAINSWQFNITLVFSAMLLVALIDYIFVILQQAIPRSRKLSILRVLLTLTALCLGGVGMFPYNEMKLFQNIHDVVARLMVVFIVVIIMLLRWLLPKISKDFLRISYLVGFLLIVATVLFLGVDYLSLMAYELLAFIFAFFWIILLLNQLQLLVNKVTSYEVILQCKTQAQSNTEESEQVS